MNGDRIVRRKETVVNLGLKEDREGGFVFFGMRATASILKADYRPRQCTPLTGVDAQAEGCGPHRSRVNASWDA